MQTKILVQYIIVYVIRIRYFCVLYYVGCCAAAVVPPFLLSSLVSRTKKG